MNIVTSRVQLGETSQVLPTYVTVDKVHNRLQLDSFADGDNENKASVVLMLEIATV